jgi:predicted flavoprotein YhiN
LLITSGGRSYPGCGTTGEGYSWARELGHTIVEPRPALVPLLTDALWVRELKGITIPDVAVQVIEPAAAGGRERVLAERRGSFLFTHFGLSGPVVLDVSRAVSGHAQPESLEPNSKPPGTVPILRSQRSEMGLSPSPQAVSKPVLVLQCDFFPTMSIAEFEAQLRAAIAAPGKRQLASLLPAELPRRLTDALLHVAGLSPEAKAAEIGHRMLARVVEAIKRVRIPIRGTCGFAKAEVTAGGVSLNEVDSHTMQSKLVPNLFFAGEVLDLDGPIGGYNFQAAWSTGYLAGLNV